MKKYKAIFWSNSNKKTLIVEAPSKKQAKITLYLFHGCDDVISIEEVAE